MPVRYKKTLIEKLKIKTGCIINKADINLEMAEKTKAFLKEKRIPLIAELPYDIQFTKAITIGKTVVEYDEGAIRNLLTESWERVKALVNENES
jgi:MinD superfamily P-loop ATPase